MITRVLGVILAAQFAIVGIKASFPYILNGRELGRVAPCRMQGWR
jgi:hypothetical protein